MSFNPDITKQAQEIIFSREKNDTSHPNLYFNNARIQQQSVQKLPRSSLQTVYKCFIRSHPDYGDVIYDQPNPPSLVNKIESVQYNAALAITGAIGGTSKEKLYQELGFESLKDRRGGYVICTKL